MTHTLVLGASINPSRASNKAIRMLVDRDFEVTAIGVKGEEVVGIPIHHDPPVIEDLHTVTLYLNPQRQLAYYDYIFSLSPKRIIFNPGTENVELMELARKQGVEVVIACSLVMLTLGEF